MLLIECCTRSARRVPFMFSTPSNRSAVQSLICRDWRLLKQLKSKLSWFGMILLVPTGLELPWIWRSRVHNWRQTRLKGVTDLEVFHPGDEIQHMTKVLLHVSCIWLNKVNIKGHQRSCGAFFSPHVGSGRVSLRLMACSWSGLMWNTSPASRIMSPETTFIINIQAISIFNLCGRALQLIPELFREFPVWRSKNTANTFRRSN